MGLTGEEMTGLEGVSLILTTREARGEKKGKKKIIVQLLFLKGNLGQFPPPQEITEWFPPHCLQGMKTFTILRKQCGESRTT